MSNRMKVKYLSVIVLQLQVHLYSFICHLQVVSHGTIAFIDGSRSVPVLISQRKTRNFLLCSSSLSF